MDLVMKEKKNLSTPNPIPSENIFQKGEIKPFSDKNKECIARAPTLQEILKEVWSSRQNMIPERLGSA